MPTTAAVPPTTTVVRAIEGSDGPRLVRFHEALSPDAQRSRFFNVHPHLSATEVEHFTHVDHIDREALVVLNGPDIVAVGRYDRLPGRNVAEVAFVTADDHRGRGLASLLLIRLAARARIIGVTEFVAQTLPENRKMLGVFSRSGLLEASAFHNGLVDVSMSLDQDPSAFVTDLRCTEPELDAPAATAVELYWIPLGAGASAVRRSGRLFEAIAAALRRRRPCDLYHSALEVRTAGIVHAIEMAPVPDNHGEARGVVGEGAVGARWLGRIRVFRYEIRSTRDAHIPDRGSAVGGAIVVSEDAGLAQRVVELVASVPTPVWGRDELDTGEMWNSNSVTSWLLTAAGVNVAAVQMPSRGRAPGWDAGVKVAQRKQPST